MLKNLSIILLGLLAGLSLGFFIITYLSDSSSFSSQTAVLTAKPKEVLGFLPYWLLTNAKPDYSGEITDLDYFSLTPNPDGTIMKYTSPGQSEPGYLALTSGKMDSFFQTARQDDIKLSLTIFDGDQNGINQLISNPITNADNLINDITPIMSQYSFSDLNMDIESTGTASPSAQINYQSFIHEIRQQISAKKLNITMSMDIIPVDFIRNTDLAVPANLAKDLDKIVVMAYDFHSPSSYVTGPVAPLYGAGTIAEFDTQVAVDAALKIYDPSKILLGLPFYGYSWETIDNFERAAILPSSSIIESNKDVENLLSNCATCSAQFDDIAQESYIIYKNQDTGTYQQIFYPDEKGVESKINFATGNNLGGLAIWALGYENPNGNIFNPIQNYLSK